MWHLKTTTMLVVMGALGIYNTLTRYPASPAYMIYKKKNVLSGSVHTLREYTINMTEKAIPESINVALTTYNHNFTSAEVFSKDQVKDCKKPKVNQRIIIIIINNNNNNNN